MPHKKDVFSPARVIIQSFLFCILVGTLLLMLPFATTRGISPVNALFTATSATCVTGLVVTDTCTSFTFFGQLVILLLIQIGGLGLITLTSFFTMALRRRMDLRRMQLAGESINADSVSGAMPLLATVIRLAMLFEGLGFLLLSFRFVPQFGPRGIWISIFMSISAFCNAGFDVLGFLHPYCSLTPYALDPYVQIIIMLLIVGGGLGFIVWQELVDWPHSHHFSLHTRVVLVFTTLLLVFGTAIFAFLEWHNPQTLGPLSPGYKLLNSLFQSVSTRTAGINTVDLAHCQVLTQMSMCVLMFIGAAPGGTGGGIKVTTFAVLAVTVANVICGREDAVIFGRRVDKKTVYRSLSVAILSFLAVIVAMVTIFFNTSASVTVMDSLFEAVSAFATVGLTLGATALLQVRAKLIIAFVMFVGRVGPVSLAIGLTRTGGDGASRVILPEGKISVG